MLVCACKHVFILWENYQFATGSPLTSIPFACGGPQRALNTTRVHT